MTICGVLRGNDGEAAVKPETIEGVFQRLEALFKQFAARLKHVARTPAHLCDHATRLNRREQAARFYLSLKITRTLLVARAASPKLPKAASYRSMRLIYWL